MPPASAAHRGELTCYRATRCTWPLLPLHILYLTADISVGVHMLKNVLKNTLELLVGVAKERLT